MDENTELHSKGHENMQSKCTLLLRQLHIIGLPIHLLPSLKVETWRKSSHQNLKTVKISALASSSGMLLQCTSGKHFDRKSSFFKTVVSQYRLIRICKSKHQEEESWKGGELVYR